MSRKRGHWFSVEANFAWHPKFIGLPLDAIGLWLKLMGYCAMHHTDGFVPDAAIRLAIGGRSKAAMNPLLDRKVIKLDPNSGGVWIENYLDYQQSRSEFEANLDRNRDRLTQFRGQKRGMKRTGNENETLPDRDRDRDRDRDKDLKDLSQTLRAVLPDGAATPVPGLLVQLPIGNGDSGNDGTARRHATASDDEPPAPKDASLTPKRARKPKAPNPEPDGFLLVVRTYFEAFNSVHGRDPTFDGYSGRSIKTLLSKVGGADQAIACIKAAFSDQYWRDKVTIQKLAQNPDQYWRNQSLSKSGMYPRSQIREAVQGDGKAIPAEELQGHRDFFRSVAENEDAGRTELAI